MIANLQKEVDLLNDMIRQNDEEFTMEIQVTSVLRSDTTMPCMKCRRPSGSMKCGWIRTGT